jgi:pyruvate dehydrogenase E2 component (dihydrolipoyllysine-residue acetyltransferase)
MARLLRMPQVAAAADAASLQTWLVTEGEAFSAGSPLLVVETDKAQVEVEADGDGVLLRVLVPAGATVDVGGPIAVLGDPGEGADAAAGLLAAVGAGPAGPDGGTAAPGAELPAAAGGDGSAPAPARAEHSPGSVAAAGSGRIFASPLARRLARSAGLDLTQLTGSGPGGRIVRKDVETAIGARAAQQPAPAAGAAPGASAVPGPGMGPLPPAGLPAARLPAAGLPPAGAEFDDVPHTWMRRAIAARLTASKQQIPHFYLSGTCELDRLLDLRGQLNADPRSPAGDGRPPGPAPAAAGRAPARISVNDLLLTAVSRAHTLVPELNAVWTQDAVRRFRRVDVAVAIATDGGLVTPVLRGVDRMTVSEVSARARDLAERARRGQLQQAELEGGTITVTNLGMFGTEEFAAIINPPHASILAVGAATRQPVVRGDRVEIATVMRVTLSVDHRAVDGVTAARWLQEFTGLVGNPVRILA